MNILRYISIPVRLYRKYHYHKIFGHIGRKSSVDSPLRLQGPENIYIGDNVGVHYKTWLAALPLTQMVGETVRKLRPEPAFTQAIRPKS